MTNRQRLRAVYDDELRREAELAGADSVQTWGPLLLAQFADLAFITYRDLDGFEPAGLVSAVALRIEADPSVREAEWKTRGHDHAPGLEEALRSADFQRDQTEFVMLGPASALSDAPTPDGVIIREATTDEHIVAALRMQDAVFGSSYADRLSGEILARRRAGDALEVWTAELDGEIVCAGRIDPVPGTDIAGIWGGATRADVRGRGIYRALTAARVRSAMERHGVQLIHSDSTPASRPILERAGLVCVTTTTPWRWRRGITPPPWASPAPVAVPGR